LGFDFISPLLKTKKSPNHFDPGFWLTLGWLDYFFSEIINFYNTILKYQTACIPKFFGLFKTQVGP